MADRVTEHAKHHDVSTATGPKAGDAAFLESAPPPELSEQKELGLSQEVERTLADNHAYVYRKDERGNLLIRSLKGDPTSPRSWPNWKRYGVVILASTLNNLVSRLSLFSTPRLTNQVCLCVSGYSTGVEQMQEEFGFSAEIGTLGLSLYVVSDIPAFRMPC